MISNCSEKILFIDDEETLCSKVNEFLRLKGFEVTIACNGAEGIEILKEEEFPLIITDIHMPVADGFEVLKYVKNNLPDSLLIMLTGYDTVENVNTALSNRVYDYVVKPFDCNHMLITINRAFEVLQLKRRKDLVEKKLKSMTDENTLTGLLNGQNFYNVLSEEIKRTKRYKKRLSLMVLEFDDLKKYSNSNGYKNGNSVLRKIGDILKTCTREIDSCYHYDEQKFAVILPETDIANSRIVAKRIYDAFEEVKKVSDGILADKSDDDFLNIRIGLSKYQKGFNADEFVKSTHDTIEYAMC